MKKLTNEEMKTLVGGLYPEEGSVSGQCAVRVSNAGGGVGATGLLDFGTQSSGSAASGAANSWCVSHIASYGGSCNYDCAWDGYTASWNPWAS